MGELDGGEPEAAGPDAAEPETPEPDAAEPDAAEPDAAEPDGPEPDGAVRPAVGGEVASASARPRRRWVRRLAVGGAALLVLGAVVLGGVVFLVQRYAASVHQEHLLGGAAATVAGTSPSAVVHAPIGGAVNILLVGIDERLNDPSFGARSDSILIAHITADHNRAYLISIPRDSRVQIPAYGPTGYRGGIDKINAAFSFGYQNDGGRDGGFELLGLTVKQLTGASFNAGAIVNFAGLQKAVDAVGGVDMCVDEETTSIHIGWNIVTGKQGAPYVLSAPSFNDPRPVPGMRPQVYHVGCQHFVGWQALDYVRQRELIPDGDYGRQRHQQQLIKALATQVSGSSVLTDPLATDRALRAIGDSVTFDGNGVSVTDWMFALRGIDPSAITMVKTNGGQFTTQVIGGQDFEILNATTQQLFAALRDDTVDAFVTAHPDWVSSPGGP